MFHRLPMPTMAALAAGSLAAADDTGIDLIDPAALGFGAPAVTLDSTWQDTLDYDSGQGGLDLWEVRALSPLAKWESGDWLTGASFNYEFTHADFGPLFGSHEFHELEAGLFSAWRPEGSKWWGLGFVKAGVATDFEDVGADALKGTALAIAGYKWSDTLDVAGGVFAWHSVGETRVLPAVGFLWRPTRQWIVQATPPIVAIGWRPNDDWTLGLVSYPAGGGWETAGNSEGIRQVDLTLWRAALSVERRLAGNWLLSVRGGVGFGGELELRDSDERVIESRDLDPAAFGAVALKYQF